MQGTEYRWMRSQYLCTWICKHVNRLEKDSKIAVLPHHNWREFLLQVISQPRICCCLARCFLLLANPLQSVHRQNSTLQMTVITLVILQAIVILTIQLVRRWDSSSTFESQGRCCPTLGCCCGFIPSPMDNPHVGVNKLPRKLQLLSQPSQAIWNYLLCKIHR